MLTEDEIRGSASKFKLSLSQRQSDNNYSESGEEESTLQAEAGTKRSSESSDDQGEKHTEDESSLSDKFSDTLIASETQRLVTEKSKRVEN